MDERTDGQRQSDVVWARLTAGYVRVVTTAPQGSVPAGSVFWTLPKLGLDKSTGG